MMKNTFWNSSDTIARCHLSRTIVPVLRSPYATTIYFLISVNMWKNLNFSKKLKEIVVLWTKKKKNSKLWRKRVGHWKNPIYFPNACKFKIILGCIWKKKKLFAEQKFCLFFRHGFHIPASQISLKMYS